MGTASPLYAEARQADFNGDGVADLAIGVPFERVAGFAAAGAVHVIYGKSNGGLDAAGDQFWTQDSSGINGVPADNDRFGGALAVGDFDDDGFSDLAIGCYADEINAVDGAGSVTVLYGSSSGLQSSGDQLWHRDVTGVLGDLQASALFGFSLAAGDFNNDGRDDLAVGVRQQNVGGENAAGEVHILYGSGSGLTAAGDQVFNDETPGIDGVPENADLFGHALAAGDFDNDGFDDLAIGIPQDIVGATSDAGAVRVLYGTPAGLDASTSQLINQDVGAIDDAAESGEGFGISLAVGDFDHNGKDDLAIGVPAESINGQDAAGAVHVLYGSASGLRTDNADFWHQDVSGIADAPESNDRFGESLATGDFDHNGKDDLAIGVPGESINEHEGAGAVHVLYGSNGGLTATGDQFWHQDSAGIPDKVEDSDFFGSALAAGDYDNDGHDDLAIGAPQEKFSGLAQAGVVHVIYGDGNGLKSSGNQLWHQNVGGIADVAAAFEYFGSSLR